MNSHDFSKNLKLVRKYFSYSQRKMGELAGVSRGAYRSYEDDARNMDAISLYMLSENLGVAVDLFFEESEERLHAHLASRALLSCEEKKLLSAFRRLSYIHQAYFLGEIERFIKL